MGNRLLRESICTSESINQLSWFHEVFWYRLIVNVDDFGRLDARPAILKARLFPLKTLTNAQIVAALNAGRSAGMFDLYEVDGHPYLQIRNWEKYQTIRTRHSKYPSPVKESVTDDASTCKMMQTNENICLSESNTNTNPKHNTSSAQAPDVDVRFARFWKAYPKKVSKFAAEKSFKKINPDDSLLETMINAINTAKASAQWQKENGQFIPNPSTWLNQRRWEDEIEPSQPQREVRPDWLPRIS